MNTHLRLCMPSGSPLSSRLVQRGVAVGRSTPKPPSDTTRVVSSPDDSARGQHRLATRHR